MATLNTISKEKLDELIKALIAGGYNAKPGKLRQGCATVLFYNEDGSLREGTEEEWDEIFNDNL